MRIGTNLLQNSSGRLPRSQRRGQLAFGGQDDPSDAQLGRTGTAAENAVPLGTRGAAYNRA